MKETLVRALVIFMLLVGSTAVAMAVFHDEVKSVLFASEFDDY